jgi:hypothetical protein
MRDRREAYISSDGFTREDLQSRPRERVLSCPYIPLTDVIICCGTVDGKALLALPLTTSLRLVGRLMVEGNQLRAPLRALYAILFPRFPFNCCK